MLIDAHVHLQERVLLEDLEGVMRSCREEGVGVMVCNGTRPEDWADVAAIAGRFPEVVPCFAVHPWYVAEAGEAWEAELRDFLSRHASAVGETGIDRWIEPRDEALQERVFRRHLQIGAEFDRPVMVHCLRAWGWLLEVLQSEKRPPAMLIHSYGGSADMVAPLARMNAYFSFSGAIFEPKRQKLRDAVKAIPRERLLVETDAPAMIPPEERRKYQVVSRDGEVQNHPANLRRVYEGIAELVGWEVEELIEQCKANARNMLGELWDERR